MKMHELRKQTISALFVITNNPTYDYDTRKTAELELRKRMKNLGYDYDTFAQDELKVIQRRGENLNNYLVGPKPNMQLLMELYFRLHNSSQDDSPLLFSENHLCNDYNNPHSFFSSICRMEVGNIEEKMTTKGDTEALVEAYNILLNRLLCTRWDASIGGVDIDSVAHQDVFCYNHNISEEQKSKISSSKVLSVKDALIGKIDSTLMQTDIAKWVYVNKLLMKDGLLLAKQKQRLRLQAFTGYNVDYDADEMKDALGISR